MSTQFSSHFIRVHPVDFLHEFVHSCFIMYDFCHIYDFAFFEVVEYEPQVF